MNRTQRTLFVLAAIFLGFYSLALTISPAVVARSWDVDYRWSHWLGYLVWLGGFAIAHNESSRRLAQRDPYLLPLIGLLTGWGLLTIWRLTTRFGIRQTIWLAVALAVLVAGMRLASPLSILRRYKYLWLTSGLLLTALTLIFGTNPMGFGPRLWLGCCGVYLQPSEPLKLLLIVYLAAFFADWGHTFVKRPDDKIPHSLRSSYSALGSRLDLPQLRILIPTLVMTGVALLLLLVQRDLGTASLFIFIYSAMIYLALGWRMIPLFSALGLGLAGVAGYALFDVVRLRVDAWFNPWLDPSGRSYQIVQSLIAVANGGIFGRGAGMGNPNVVPVAHSDFVFTAMVEETGLVGALGLLALLGLLLHRGMRTALRARDAFSRYLAGGLTAYLVAQSILIIGGNLRLLPLTGVTLPFVSYGGSSLLISFIAILLLLHISSNPNVQRSTFRQAQGKQSNVQRFSSHQLFHLTAILLTSLTAAAFVNGWWSVQRGPDLLTRTDNPRRAIADLSVPRGALLDRHNTPLVETTGQSGDFIRTTLAPSLGPVLGYNHPIYGQAGLEASLDDYLRGLQGQGAMTIWWHHLLYGQSPPGLDVRLTINLELQRIADDLLGDHTGAIVLLNAKNGEILAMASHPTYDPNLLDETWDELIQDDSAPLLNRAIQGRYPIGDLLGSLFPNGETVPWLEPAPLRLPGSELLALSGATGELEATSPMTMAQLAAAISNGGIQPALRIAQAYQNPLEQWVLLPPLGEPVERINANDARGIAAIYEDASAPTWHLTLTPNEEALTWYIGGTTPEWENTPFALIIILEEENLSTANEIGAAILSAALTP
ncbi:MAG: FtsW/RodA/SpoVE family cell cycle protein [Anaerolineales bacterium]|nr:FtsW/RodA/SpoVE family cell cycle protein [Chloroflexota bacterium]MBL6979678.1 FtsW/RodA/SpoVE family cell cycle protein [Anaerolineales bacterium]